MRITAGRATASLVSLAVVAAAIWFLLPAPVPVEISTVAKGRFVATVDEDGKTRVRERYVVTAPLTGRLARVRLKVGDAVGEGAVITTIQPSPAPLLDPRSRLEATEKLGAAEANLDRAKAAVGRTNAQNRQADRDLARARTLFERNVGSPKPWRRRSSPNASPSGTSARPNTSCMLPSMSSPRHAPCWRATKRAAKVRRRCGTSRRRS